MTTNDPNDQGDSCLQVLVFGSQAQTVQRDVLDITGVEFPVTASELLNRIASQYPDLAPSIGVSRLAVDHEFVDDASQIAEGCEVALVGLISGG